MGESRAAARVAIAVALIGLVGTLGAALIANWDDVFGSGRGSPPEPTATTIVGPTDATSTEIPPTARPDCWI